MNQYSLKFENQQLEDKYMMYSNKQQIQQIRTFLKITYPMLFFQTIACFSDGSYIAAGLSLALMGSITILLKATTKLNEPNAIRLYEISTLMNPLVALIAFYLSNSLALTINIMVLILVGTQIFVLTPNIFLAVIHLFNNFLANIIIMYQIFGFTLYMLTWIPIFLFCVYRYYIQKRNERLLFQESQVNESIYNLIQETVDEDDVIYFKFNSELLEYELEFSSICELNLNSFLSSIKTDSKENLKSYFFSKINSNHLKFTKERLIAYKNQQRVELEIYIQYYPVLRFYIRIIREQKSPFTFTENESRQMYSFYKEIMLLCKHKSYMLNLHHILKKLLSFNAKVTLAKIIKSPNKFQQQSRQFNVVDVLKQYMINLQLKFEIEPDKYLNETIVQSQIIFQTMIYYILRLIKVKNSSLNLTIHSESQEIALTFKFRNNIHYYKLQEHRLRFLQDLLSFKQLIIQNDQIRCFIDQNEDIAFT